MAEMTNIRVTPGNRGRVHLPYPNEELWPLCGTVHYEHFARLTAEEADCQGCLDAQAGVRGHRKNPKG